MKRILIIIGVCLAVLLIGNIFTIGGKIGAIPTVGNYMEGIFYVAIVVAVVYYIIRPIYCIQHAPESPKLSCDSEMSADDLHSFGRRLALNCYYIADETMRNRHCKLLRQNIEKNAGNKLELQSIIDKELKLRFKGDSTLKVKGIDRRIIEWAKTVFVTTSISQSSKLDTALVFYLNLKMMEDIIRASGFRPSRKQLIKTYARIVTTAIVAYGVSEVLEDADLEDIAGTVVDTAGDASDSILPDVLHGAIDNIGSWIGKSTMGFLLKSAGDGAVNCLLTLRIGFVTKQYLRYGRAAITGSRNRSQTRKTARREAYKHIKDIVVSSREEVNP